MPKRRFTEERIAMAARYRGGSIDPADRRARSGPGQGTGQVSGKPPYSCCSTSGPLSWKRRYYLSGYLRIHLYAQFFTNGKLKYFSKKTAGLYPG